MRLSGSEVPYQMAQGFGKHLPKALGYGVFGVIFFGLTASAFASATLDLLANAAARFSAAIEQQLVIVQNDPAPTEFAEKRLAYAEAKVAYFTALRDEMPELTNIASGKEPRPLQLDRFAQTFSVAGEKQEKAADEKTLVFLQRFSGDPDIRRRGQNSSVLKKSKRPFIRISTESTSRFIRERPLFACSLERSPWSIFFARYMQNSAHDAEFP